MTKLATAEDDEEIADGVRESGHRPMFYSARFVKEKRLHAIVQLNDPLPRVYDDDQRRTGAQVDADLIVEVDAPVVG